MQGNHGNLIKRIFVKRLEPLKKVSLPAPPPSFKSDFRMASFMFEDETKLSGAAAILRKYSSELNLTDESILTHGDQLTVARILGVQDSLVNEESKKNRLEGFVPVLGGFHFRWKFLREVLDSHWGSQNIPGSISHARVFLNRKQRVDRKAKHFNHCHELIEDLIEAHCIAWLWRMDGKEGISKENMDAKVGFKEKGKRKKEKGRN